MSARPVRLLLDPIACDGHGVCAELLPELVSLDDWGYPIIAPGDVPPELVRHAKWAIANCPRLALSLVASEPTLTTSRAAGRPIRTRTGVRTAG
jgi:ferredoxin